MEQQTLLDLIARLRTVGQEWDTVDAKRELILRENGDKAEFVKDVVAMANNAKSSCLIIGLQDATFDAVGILTHRYHQNDIIQILADKIDPPVVVGYQEFDIEGNQYAVVEIFGKNPPYLVARDIIFSATDRKKVRLHKGTIYVRQQDRTEGISRAELDYLFQRRALYKVFEHESERAQYLAQSQPEYWEYLLTAELFRTKLAAVSREFADVRRGIVVGPVRRMTGPDFLQFIMSKRDELLALLHSLNEILNHDVTASWGPPGVAGDPVEIKRVTDKIVESAHEALHWESDLRRASPPHSYRQLQSMMEGWAYHIYSPVESLPDQLHAIFQVPRPTGQFDIQLNILAPPNVVESRRFCRSSGAW